MSQSSPSQAGIDEATVVRIAHLARVEISAGDAKNLQRELNRILAWVAELNAIPTGGISPLTGIGPAALPMRDDVVTDGGVADLVLQNAPVSEDRFFVVPKVIE